jgi:tetraacyldisaccharide 4'-kinase
LLPAGPLRESASRLQDVDFVISNGDWPSKPANIKTGSMALEGQALYPLEGSGLRSSAELFSAQSQQHPARQVHVFAGIGNPDRFFNALWLLNQKAPGESVAAENWHQHRRPDHHTYQKTDFENVPGGAIIVMTEKDAVKCRKLGLDNAWYLPVDAVLDTDFVQWYGQQLELLKQDPH